MSQTQNQAAANNNETVAARPRAYNMAGIVSDVAFKTDVKGKPYAKFRFDFFAAGRKQTRVTMAFGKAFAEIKDTLKDGPMRLFAKFDNGVLAVIGLGYEPKSEAQKKAA